MVSWSSRRKIIFLSILGGFVALLVAVPAFFLWHETPTCFDSKQNGDEAGVDCGGSCRLLCSFDAISPNVLWTRSFRVAPGVYSAVAYVENHNITSSAVAVPYVFKLYDASNNLITTRENVAYVPKNSIFPIFEANIKTGAPTPVRTSFEFTQAPVWNRDDTVMPEIVVDQKRLSGENVAPRIDATIRNASLVPVAPIPVVAIVYDGKGNAIGASRTVIDRLAKDQAEDVVFTWPTPFETQSRVCKVPADVMLVVDRSGSMASDNTNPPQPLTDVKNAAISFVNHLGDNDRAGIVSYADTASSPRDALLTSNFSIVRQAIEAIAIGTTTIQQTNIADGIGAALAELVGARGNTSARKVIVALTDGVPTRPLKEGDERYPETAALTAAQSAKDAGVQIYTVGLGGSVKKELLETLASTPEDYFPVLTSRDLERVYTQIATSICVESPTTFDVIPLFVPPTKL